MSAGPLSGRGIVVTRPREHAGALAERIAAAGGDPVLFPTIEIAPPDDPGAARRVIAALDGFQMAIFMSPTAAIRGYDMTSAARTWPRNVRVAAVGAGTAKALEERGFLAVISPVGSADSEALAALPELVNVAGQSIAIFRGEGGREWLRSELEARGARVEYAECYRRVRPQADTQPLRERWQRGGIHAVSITSAEGLEYFAQMLGAEGVDYLRATPTFVPHPRIALVARKLGVQEVVVTGRGDDQTVAGMTTYFATV